MSDYPEFTPTTDEIRERWMNFDSEPDATDAAEFDRWLQNVRAKAFEDAAFEAARPAGNRVMEFSERQRIIVNRIRNLV